MTRVITTSGLAAIAICAALSLTGCSFIQRVDRECAYDLGPRPNWVCACRNMDTGRFVRCPQ